MMDYVCWGPKNEAMHAFGDTSQVSNTSACMCHFRRNIANSTRPEPKNEAIDAFRDQPNPEENHEV